MKAIVDRLIAAGHKDKVWEAGQFAKLKAESPVRWEPDCDHPANELFALINAAANPSAIWDYIFDACYVREDMSDYWNYDAEADAEAEAA